MRKTFSSMGDGVRELLKQLTSDLITEAGDLKGARHITGLSLSQLSNFQNTASDHTISAEALYRLSAATQNLSLIQSLERLVLRSYKPEGDASEHLFAEVLRLQKESSESVTQIMKAMADGTLTYSERVRCIAELSDTVNVSLSLINYLNHAGGHNPASDTGSGPAPLVPTVLLTGDSDLNPITSAGGRVS